MMPSDLDGVARSLLMLVLDSAVRAGVIAGVIGVAVFAVRARGAALQLGAWTAVLLASLAIPALMFAVPTWQWSVPILPFQHAGQPAALLLGSSGVSAAGYSTIAAPGGTFDVSGPMLAVAIYVAGVFVLLMYTGFGWLATRRLRVSARPVVDEALIDRTARHASAAGLRQSPVVIESSSILVPVTMSVMRPVLALPADWREWLPEKLDAVLIHEIAHVARRDALTQRLSLFYRAAFWFSPLSWWLHRHIAHLAEQASDEAALGAGVAPTTYAETLLDCFTRLQKQTRRVEWHVAMARRADADAARRMERILTWKGRRMIMRPKLWLVGLVLLALPVTALTASVRFEPVVAELPAVPSLQAAVPAPAPLVLPAAVPSTPASLSGAQSTPPPSAPVQSAPPQKPTPPTPQPTPQQTGRPVSAEPPDDFEAGTVAATDPGVVAPKVLLDRKPRYTAEAMRAKLQGDVVVEIIVLADGTVGKARVVNSLDTVLGLDNEAMAAAKGWTFIPGTLNGENVAVRVKLEMHFRLH